MLQCNGILLINTEGLSLSAIWENISIYKKEKVELRRLSCKHNDSLCCKPNQNKTGAIWRRECWPLSRQPRSFFPSLYTEYTYPDLALYLSVFYLFYLHFRPIDIFNRSRSIIIELGG